MHQEPHHDGPTAAQIAQLIESASNQKEDVREIKAALVQITQSMVVLTSMQRDVAHLDEKVRRLFTVADQRGPEITRLDKRVTGLERWHKIIGTGVLASLGAVGWGVQRVEYLYRMDNRIAILELLQNGKQVEQTMSIKPPATGHK